MTKEKCLKYISFLFTHYNSFLLEQLNNKPEKLQIPLLKRCLEEELCILNEMEQEYGAIMAQFEASEDCCEMLREQLAMNKWQVGPLLAHIEHWMSTKKRPEPELKL